MNASNIAAPIHICVLPSETHDRQPRSAHHLRAFRAVYQADHAACSTISLGGGPACVSKQVPIANMQWLELLETAGGSVEARLQACTDAVAFMQPFLQAGTHASDRSVAAQHGRPVMRLLKAVSALLSSSASNTQLDEAYAQVAVSALNSLEAMRSALNTKGLELARQRYALVRKLMSREQFQHALAQASKLHAQLGPYECSGAPGYDKETVDLQLAAAISILVCAAGLLSSGRQGDGASHAAEAMLRVHASLPVLHGFIQQQLSM